MAVVISLCSGQPSQRIAPSQAAPLPDCHTAKSTGYNSLNKLNSLRRACNSATGATATFFRFTMTSKGVRRALTADCREGFQTPRVQFSEVLRSEGGAGTVELYNVWISPAESARS